MRNPSGTTGAGGLCGIPGMPRLFAATLASVLVALSMLPVHAESAEEAPEVEVQEVEAPAVEETETEEVPVHRFGADPEADDAPVHRLGTLTVIGSREAEFALPGAGSYLATEDIRTQNYDDINRVLRRVPGVYVREEDGFGLMPNISLRGADMGRSSKVNIMEDGIITAPAPYSAPAAYYSPAAGRMHAIEVLKGSSQVRYGPHTTGGVVNYISTPIPLDQKLFLRTTYGSDNDVRLHAYFGDTVDTGAGRVGYLLELFGRHNDGFQTIDETFDFRRGDRTGFRRIEPMLKLSFEPNTAVYQHFEFKAGYTNLDADISYLGLSDRDFRRDPYRRYAASRFDNIKTEQWRTYLRHYIEPTDDLNITTTVYYNNFARNWAKLHDLRGNYVGSGGLAIRNPSLSGAIAAGGTALDALRGQAPGTLRFRDNNRTYEAWGIDTVTEYSFETGAASHRLTVGLRYHEDRVRRFQHDTIYGQNTFGNITSRFVNIRGSQDNRRANTRALALFVQDDISIGDWTISPGVRYEHLRHAFKRFNTGESGTGSLNMFAGGVGVTYDVNDNWVLFGGGHFGFSPPEPESRISGNLKEERSFNTELGVRYRDTEGAFSAQATYFHTWFRDLLVRENIGGGGTGDESVGRVRTQGVELSLSYDLGIARGWSFNNPYYLAATWTRSRLGSDTGSANAESIFSGGTRGSQVPYVPEWTIAGGTGIEFERWGADISGIFVDSAFTTASNTRTFRDIFGNPDARFGKTDSHFLVDLSAYYRMTEHSKLFAGVQNALNRKYISSRHPHGARPGAPQFFYAGLEASW